MRLARLFVCLALAACGSKSSSSTTPTPPAGGAGAGPAYAALFEDGKTLRYARTTESSMYDPDDPQAGEGGIVKAVGRTEHTCTVRARTLGAWQAARLTCQPAADDDELLRQVQLVWVADARGVWRTEATELPADEQGAAKLATGEPLLLAAPAPVDEKHEEEEGFGESHTIAQAADGTWCVSRGSWGGDEGGDSWCFRAGAGLTRASTYFAGGSTRDDAFELLP